MMSNVKSNVNAHKDVIGILTGGGDVPGLNPAIRAVTIRALREGYEVIGLPLNRNAPNWNLMCIYV